MPAEVLTESATVQCPHGGRVQARASRPRVRSGRQPLLHVGDSFTVSGCPYAVGTKPQPCVQVQWSAGARRVRIGGQPAVLRDSQGQCLSAEQIPQGAPVAGAVQPRVRGV
jgi:uncharacterized Zn-binding protein involved in type VI secretion